MTGFRSWFSCAGLAIAIDHEHHPENALLATREDFEPILPRGTGGGFMARRRRQRSPYQQWNGFARRHWSYQFLNENPLYALSEPIIDAIQNELPQFFTSDDEGFERDLARTTSFGFFNRIAYGDSEQDRQRAPRNGLPIEQTQDPIDQELLELQTHYLRQHQLTQDEIQEYFRQQAATQEAIGTRQNAYTGWLICNGAFRNEIATLRENWGAIVEQLGSFPLYPRWPYQYGRRGQDDFHEACYQFYRRWGLERMVTWDWPSPMDPDLFVAMREDLADLSDAGVVLFLPWYLLRGEKIDLRSVVEQARTTCSATHLRGWLSKSGGAEEGSDVGLANLTWIYRYYELVLNRRHGPACRGHLQELDRALARGFKRDEDTVKKLRLKLKRNLGSS